MIDDDQEPSRTLSMDDVILAVRTAAEAYGVKSFVVVGRGSLAASMSGASAELRATMDVDLFPPWDESKAAVWAAADTRIGRRSAFRAEHGFYVERVGEWTLLSQPKGWEDRALRMRVDDIEVAVLHPLDLAYNKLEAGREKDLAFMAEGLRSGAFVYAEVRRFIENAELDVDMRPMVLQALDAAKKGAGLE